MMTLNKERQSYVFGFRIRKEYRLPYTYLRELSKVNPSYKNGAISWQKIFEFGCMTMEGLYPNGYRITAPKYEETRLYNNTNTFTGTIIEDIKKWEPKLEFNQAEVIEFFAWLYFSVHMTEKEKVFFCIDQLDFHIDPIRAIN
ncbi:hypothetical protein QK289_15690 [Exiguobacterium antarcticum]|uniref:Uncharacterized protein n=1 Tax=Exiguobacterium antarcticum TaxID=132920 RepID=A0ABT6R6I8_9BACL|nr:hypothetical protein [Exiguobacterium antarcticum]MDI3236458.1 hypothetical protein [Exiguobacterium antarcticum]